MTNEKKRAVFESTDGKCHICGKQLAWSNHGKRGRRGAWHIDHSVARALGGTDHGNNLKPACINCNQEKGTKTTRSARAQHGRTKAPPSKKKKAQRRASNRASGGAIGASVGAWAGGPVGGIIGGFVGAALGDAFTDDD